MANWNILAQPLPEPTQFNPLAAVNAYRQGEQDFRVQRKDNALTAAGRSMAAGDTKAAQATLYGAGEFDAGFKIGQHQLQQAQHELEVWQRVGKLAENASPEQWQQTLQMYQRAGVKLPPEYLDPVKGRELARAHAYDAAARLQQGLIRAQTEMARAHAGLFSAQTKIAQEKPAVPPIKLGPGETLVDPRTYTPVMQTPEKAPPGYEPDPQNPGRLRPKPGGPADQVTGEQAARVALLSQAKSLFPELARIYLGDDKTPPVVPDPLDVRRGGVVAGSVQHYGGFGDAAQGYRIVTTGTEAILRALTGAAAPEPEVKRVAEKYMPLPGDNLDTRRKKLKLFEEAIDLMGGLIAKGVSSSDVAEAFKAGNIDALRARVTGQTPTRQPQPARQPQLPQVPGISVAPPAPPPGFEIVK